jgi:putative transposase
MNVLLLISLLQLADRSFIISKEVFITSSSLKALLNPTPIAGFSNYNKVLPFGSSPGQRYHKEVIQMNDTHSLSHTKWNCKYHIVFAPKYRRKVFYEDKRIEVGVILRELCKWKGVNIIEAEVCPDHIHMLLEIPPKISISSFMGFLKGKSSLMIYEKWGNMKYKYRNREFWCRGYYVDTAGKDAKKIKEYIQRQLRED